MFCTINAICAQISIPIPPVPVSLSLLAVFTCGALLDMKNAAFSQIAYLLIGVIGIPVFVGFKSGLGALFGPTGGYLAVYPLMAVTIAFIRDRFKAHGLPALVLGMFVSLIECYLFGTLWLCYQSKLSFVAALSSSVLPFIALDCIKIALSALLCRALQKKPVISQYLSR